LVNLILEFMSVQVSRSFFRHRAVPALVSWKIDLFVFTFVDVTELRSQLVSLVLDESIYLVWILHLAHTHFINTFKLLLSFLSF